MKFLCDRCKTRYSIGDDRVRGKILKIRCKNCANVITVREGMSDAEAVDAGGVASAAPARRNRATTAAPLVAQSTALAGNGHAMKPAAGGSALGAAFASAMTKPPPALEEEWYVSIDGEQSGPFSLVDAQRWVANKPHNVELHCWSEGFDDWLPVDKVSHFRGLRKKPQPVAAPPPLPRIGSVPSRQVAMAPAPQPIIPRDEETPKPLFAATMASLEKSVPAEPPNGLPAMGSLQMRAPAPAPSATPPRGSPILPHSNGSVANRVITRPGLVVAKPAVPGFDSSEPAAAATMIEQPPFEDSGRVARPPDPTAPGDGEDDLDIGEVSRVVKLADIARQPRRDPTGSIRRSGQMAAVRQPTMQVGRVTPIGRLSTTSTPRIDGTGQVAMVDGMMMPLATPELAPVTAPATHHHRRGLFVLLGVALVLVLGVVGAVVYIVMTSDDDDTQTSQLDKGSDLINTERPPEVTIKRPEMIAPGGQTPQTHPGGTRPRIPGTAHPNGSAATPPDEPPGGQAALKSDEIEDMYGKHKFGAERCYMRAQKDPFIGDVKRIQVTLVVDHEGNVTDVSLDSHAQDTLGKCLANQVHSWKFRTSPGGTFRFTMAFAQ